MPDQRITVYYISSVSLDNASGGGIVMSRHLLDEPFLDVRAIECRREALLDESPYCRIRDRLLRTRLHRWINDWQVLDNGRWLDNRIRKAFGSNADGVVVTVATGEACWAAERFAERRQLPLVTFFHDWWPHVPELHRIFRRLLERRFLRLGQRSTASLCVCEQMRQALGSPANARVLHPIPGFESQRVSDTDAPTPSETRPFRVLYCGNLFDYGTMIRSALEELNGHPEIRLEARGIPWHWPRDFRGRMKQAGVWLELAPRNELERWLRSADALLIPMVFEPSWRQRMETSFPSKLVEFAQLGKPLVVWGPGYCSAVQWARNGEQALCVTDESPQALAAALERLSRSTESRRYLARRARQAADSDFAPEKIRQRFLDVLREANESRPRSLSPAARESVAALERESETCDQDHPAEPDGIASLAS